MIYTFSAVAIVTSFLCPIFIIFSCSSCKSSKNDNKVVPIDDSNDGNSKNDDSTMDSEIKVINLDNSMKNPALSLFPLMFSDENMIRSEENNIVLLGEDNDETCVIGDVMKNVGNFYLFILKN